MPFCSNRIQLFSLSIFHVTFIFISVDQTIHFFHMVRISCWLLVNSFLIPHIHEFSQRIFLPAYIKCQQSNILPLILLLLRLHHNRFLLKLPFASNAPVQISRQQLHFIFCKCTLSASQPEELPTIYIRGKCRLRVGNCPENPIKSAYFHTIS